jgi:ribosome maturation factor RimP
VAPATGTRARGLGVGASTFLLFAIPTDGAGLKAEDLSILFAPAVTSLGLECLGVEFSPSRGNSLVRVYIDAPERLVTIEDCEAVSRELAALLDVEDPIPGHYDLEVSSPGFDRPLFTPAHYARFVGESAKLLTSLPVGGRRRFQGPIVRVEGDTVVIAQDGKDTAIALANIQKGNLVPDYSAYTPAKPGRSPNKAAGAAKSKKL